MPTINYEPLTKPIALAEIFRVMKSEAKSLPTWEQWVTLLIASFLIFQMFLVIMMAISNKDAFIALPLIAFLLVVGVTVIYSWIGRIRTTLSLERFSIANSFFFTEKMIDPGYSGLLFNHGHSRIATNAIDGIYKGRDFSLFNYSYTIGGGKNRQTYRYGVIRVHLSRRLPHVVLDAKANNLLGKLSNLPSFFSASQKLQLEGDFNIYFNLYVPEGYGIDALYFLTPELMALLVDKGQKYDIEVVDNVLFLYRAEPFKCEEQMLQEAFDIIEHLGGEFEENTERYRDERVGSKVLNTVAMPGRRLKQGVGWPVVVFIIIIILMFIFDGF